MLYVVPTMQLSYLVQNISCSWLRPHSFSEWGFEVLK